MNKNSITSCLEKEIKPVMEQLRKDKKRQKEDTVEMNTISFTKGGESGP